MDARECMKIQRAIDRLEAFQTSHAGLNDRISERRGAVRC